MTTAINMAWRATITPPVAATLRSLPDVIVVEPALFVLMSLEKSLVNPCALKRKRNEDVVEDRFRSCCVFRWQVLTPLRQLRVPLVGC